MIVQLVARPTATAFSTTPLFSTGREPGIPVQTGPYACLTALTLPAIFYSTESVISAIAGFVVAVILGIREKGLVVVAAAACVTVFVVERILAFL